MFEEEKELKTKGGLESASRLESKEDVEYMSMSSYGLFVPAVYQRHLLCQSSLVKQSQAIKMGA